MQTTAQHLSPVLLELNVEVDADRVRAELEKAYQQLSRQATVRGFRRGKAPRSVLRHMFGARVAADVAQRLVDETYPKALDEQKVQTVSRPAIESRAVAENEPFSYKARVEILPKIASVNFEGLKVKRPSVTVSDEKLDEQLKAVQRANSVLEPAADGHVAAAGDVATVDFTVSVDGKVIKEASAENLDLELGQSAVLPEIEKALLGQRPPFETEVEVEMPANAQHPDLRGKKAIFGLALRDLKTRVLPAIDDEFAKDLGEFDSLEALKKSIGEDLGKRLEESADNAVAQRLVAELVKANPIEVPPSLVQQQLQVTEQEVLRQSRAQGRGQQLSPELRRSLVQDSEIKVRAGLLMAEIAKAKGIQIGQADIEEGLKGLAEQTGKNLAKLRAEYATQQRREMLVGMILENKVLDIIEEAAQIEQE
ncbi:MAG TPA: trigger factor [Polyangiaceae bacterium]|nr:trigger factor [Polyangiaceae bacterium]